MTIEEMRRGFHKRYLRDGSHEGWERYRCFRGECEGVPEYQFIQQQIEAGHKVKTGYTCTQIRDYHDKWILVKKSKQRPK